MFSKTFRLLLTILLVALLAYAPELFAAVSAPYAARAPERALLRIALCTKDPESAASFYNILNQYRKTSPSIHIRVIRADETQLLALSDPKPDVYVFSPGIQLQADEFLPLTFIPDGEDTASHYLTIFFETHEPLCAGVRLTAAAKNAAMDLITYLYSLSTSSPGGAG